MAKLILKSPYIKSPYIKSTGGASGYLKYIATRERVEIIPDDRPPTRKQEQLITKLVKDFPEVKELYEYGDYMDKPTKANASAFITLALESNRDSVMQSERYMKYIATRPRAQRVGSHGLFTGEEDQLVLAQVAEAVAAHPGNVWLPIISLRREDAARLGYDKAEEWKALLSEYAMEMAEAMKIPWEDFRWYAAFHDEAHHPHIHMVCYSADPSKGFLTTQGIAQIKSGLAKEIFRQELTELYQKQTQSRDTLNEDARSVLEQLIERMWSGAVVNHRMEKLMEHLAERLRHTGGRKQYGYLKAPLKAVVDEIVDELAKEPCVAAAYALWYELREDVLRTYKDDLPPRLPLSQQKEFKRIKNIVIEEAVTLGARQQVFHPDDQQDRVPVEDQEEAPLPEAPQPDNDWNDFSESPPDDVPDKTVSAPAKAQMNWSDEYRLARRCLFSARISPRILSRRLPCSNRRRKKAMRWPCTIWAGCLRTGWAGRLICRPPMCGTARRWPLSMLLRGRRKNAMRSTGSANCMPRASAVSRTMVMPPGGSNFPQTKGTSMRNIPLPACFAVDRVWNRTMRGRWSYTQPPHSRTSPMPPTS